MPLVALAKNLPAVGVLGLAPEIHSAGFDPVVALGAEVELPSEHLANQGQTNRYPSARGWPRASRPSVPRRWARIGPGAAVDGDRRLAFTLPIERHVDRWIAVPAAEPEEGEGKQAIAARSGVVRVDARHLVEHPARSPSSQSGRSNRAANQNRHASGPRRPAVGIIEKQARGAAGEAGVSARLAEPRGLAEPKIAAQGAFERGNQEDVVARAVGPIARPLRVAPLGAKARIEWVTF